MFARWRCKHGLPAVIPADATKEIALVRAGIKETTEAYLEKYPNRPEDKLHPKFITHCEDHVANH